MSKRITLSEAESNHLVSVLDYVIVDLHQGNLTSTNKSIPYRIGITELKALRAKVVQNTPAGISKEGVDL